MRAYVKQNPRSLALTDESQVLLFRYFSDRKPPAGGAGSNANTNASAHHVKCIVELSSRESFDLSDYQPLSNKECYGCLGLTNIAGDVFLCTITARREVASPRPTEKVCRIYGVEFYSLTRSEWDFIQLDQNGYALDLDSKYGSSASAMNLHDVGGAGGNVTSGFAAANSAGGSGASTETNITPTDMSAIEHPCASIRKLLSNGSFYYSTDFDLTCLLQDRGALKKEQSLDTIDESFMWNSYMMGELIKFRGRLRDEERRALDKSGFLTTVIRGFAGTVKFRLSDGAPARMTLISRQSCKRAGTRYIVRGIDDEGYVANFVETETIFWAENEPCFGYVQIRGSVPVFWEQDANLLSAKVNITRSLEATQPAFNRHFQQLVQRFGGVNIINLLSREKSGETDLTRRYTQHIVSNPQLQSTVGYTHFDFHSEVAHGGYGLATKILPRIQDAMLEFGFYSYDIETGQDVTEQIGVFRTNCLDCLDRTNVIQQVISREALELFLEYNRIEPGVEIWAKHNVLWADNGDQLSQIYAGTGALKSSFTRSGKMGLAGAIADVTKSVGRMYINNFVDKSRQNTIDLLLGRTEGQDTVELHDPVNDYVITELKRREGEFTSIKEVKIFSGTFNLNGVVTDADLRPWLFPKKMNYAMNNETNTKNSNQPDKPQDTDDYGGTLPDIYLLGFQELVELTAGQILNADSAKKQFWERQVLNCLNQSGEEYVLLRSGQLVGTALMLFVKKSEIMFVSQVEGSTKKTGLGGMAGNKGGVAVSFYFANTSFCFITAHLAAGLHNVDERHEDFKTLSAGLQFSRGRKIKDHDVVIWLGDFNYRVTLPYDRTLVYLQNGQLEPLLDADQLSNQMAKGVTFPYYNEMDIKFPPTYKFNNGTNIYDTSEKQRTPSWTDRILSRGANLRQLSYGSAPLVFSDHRPVYAVFRAQTILIDKSLKEKLASELYQKRKAEVGDTNNLVDLVELDDSMLTHGLPPPSTDTQKWWIAGKQSAKVALQPPKPGMVLNNEKLGLNPFSMDYDKKPDFVDLPKLPPRPNGNGTGSGGSSGNVSLNSASRVLSRGNSTSNSPALSPANSTTNVSSTNANASTTTKEKPRVPRKPLRLTENGHQAPPSTKGPPLPPRSRSASLRSQASATSTNSSAVSLMDDNVAPRIEWQPLQPQ